MIHASRFSGWIAIWISDEEKICDKYFISECTFFWISNGSFYSTSNSNKQDFPWSNRNRAKRTCHIDRILECPRFTSISSRRDSRKNFYSTIDQHINHGRQRITESTLEDKDRCCPHIAQRNIICYFIAGRNFCRYRTFSTYMFFKGILRWTNKCCGRKFRRGTETKNKIQCVR